MKIKTKLFIVVLSLVMIFSLSAHVSAAYEDTDGMWAEDVINEMVAKGYLDDYGDHFYPNQNLLRGEFAASLCNVYGLTETKQACVFADVPECYAAAVTILNEAGVVNGTGATTFSPFEPILRQDMAKMIAGAEQTFKGFNIRLDGGRKLSDFADSGTVSEYAQAGVTYVYQGAIMKGDGSNFNPRQNITRAEGAQMIFNLVSQKVLPTKISQDNWVGAKQYIQLDSGIKMAYVEMGQPDGEPLILLHGTTDSSRSWSLPAQYLAEDYHVYLLDQRGHGASDKPDTRMYDISVNAWDIASFMDAKGIKTAHVAGHSMGSRIAQTFAVNYPERLGSLILVGTQLIGNDDNASMDMYDMITGWTSNPVDKDFIDMWDSNPNPVDNTFLNYVKTETSMLPVKAWQAIMNREPRPLVARIKSPTLVITGSLDELAMSEMPPVAPNGVSQAVVERISGAIHLIYDNVGHNCQWEQPKRMAEDITSFIEKGMVDDPYYVNPK